MQEQRLDTDKIEQLHRRRKHRRLRMFVLLIITGALVLAYFTGLYGAGLSVLGDVVDSASAAINRGTGWPQSFTLTGFSKAESLADGFVALGENDLTMYSKSGKELRRKQHGYARPAISAGNTRVCIYNRGGTELCVESRSRTLFKKIYEQPIQMAYMNEGGSFAVITRSARYEAELTVYNSLFEPIYFWYSAQDFPSAVTMSRQSGQLAVSCLSSLNGAMGTKLYMLNTGEDEPIAEIDVPERLLLQMAYLPNGNLVAIYDRFTAVYSSKDGKELAKYDYGARTVQTAEIQGKYTALVFTSALDDTTSSLAILDEGLNEIGVSTLGYVVDSVCVGRTNVFVTGGNVVYTYGLDGKIWGSAATETPVQAVIDVKDLLAITKGSVQKIDIPPMPKKEKG
ncbi:MAG: DUF5711 family protein [Oscillospiraceae bacterium]